MLTYLVASCAFLLGYVVARRWAAMDADEDRIRSTVLRQVHVARAYHVGKQRALRWWLRHEQRSGGKLGAFQRGVEFGIMLARPQRDDTAPQGFMKELAREIDKVRP